MECGGSPPLFAVRARPDVLHPTRHRRGPASRGPQLPQPFGSTYVTASSAAARARRSRVAVNPRHAVWSAAARRRGSAGSGLARTRRTQRAIVAVLRRGGHNCRSLLVRLTVMPSSGAGHRQIAQRGSPPGAPPPPPWHRGPWPIARTPSSHTLGTQQLDQPEAPRTREINVTESFLGSDGHKNGIPGMAQAPSPVNPPKRASAHGLFL